MQSTIKITNINQLDLNKSYTYADYLNWQFDEMVELIKGKIFKMSPAPSRLHQKVSMKLLENIFKRTGNGPCEVYHAPFDVRLPLPASRQKSGKVNTVVQPDICVVCDPSKLDARGCNGAPDWIIEILSPGTASKDINEKYDIYQNAGVKEYWIVPPEEASVQAYILNEAGIYEITRPKPYTKIEKIPVSIFDGFEIALESVFTE